MAIYFDDYNFYSCRLDAELEDIGMSEEELKATQDIVQNSFQARLDHEAEAEQLGPRDIQVRTSTNPFASEFVIAEQDVNAPDSDASSTEDSGQESSKNPFDGMATNPYHNALVSKAGVDLEPNSTSDNEGLFAATTKNIGQYLTKRNILIVAGSGLLLGTGGVAAYFFYPVVAAHAPMVFEASRAALMNTHEVLIAPGAANTALMAGMVVKWALVPAIKAALPFVLPVISTALVSTVATLIFCYLAHRVCAYVQSAVWSGMCAVGSAVREELNTSVVGMGLNAVAEATVVPVIASIMAPEEVEEPSLPMIQPANEEAVEGKAPKVEPKGRGVADARKAQMRLEAAEEAALFCGM